MLIEHFFLSFFSFRPAAQIYSSLSLSLSTIKPALAHEAKTSTQTHTHTQRKRQTHSSSLPSHQHGGRVRAFHRRGKLVIIIFPTFGFLDYRSRGFSRTRARARFFIRVFFFFHFFFFSERVSLTDILLSFSLSFSLSIASGAGLPPGGREQRFIGKDEPNR